ncbi:hypothetical protein AeRB84_021313 [Aphanomyces euteiches]|nr:hypothetical protein AeRB84_021313 [Aphanomyces euteiches]
MQELLYLRTGRCYSISSIHRSLRSLGFSLQVLEARAMQRDEIERASYMDAVRRYDPECLIFIDETHKGRNNARRRRGWGLRGSRNCVSELFDPSGEKRFTVLAAADINGFVPEACQLVQRKANFDDLESAHGTVDTEGFLFWTKFYLLPVLGNFALSEPRSVVVVDNATIHHDQEFEVLVRSAGAVVLYTAPFSPDVMPIEYCFHSYKACLKRNNAIARACFWEALMDALASVSTSKMKHCMYHCGLDVSLDDTTEDFDMLACCLLLENQI